MKSLHLTLAFLTSLGLTACGGEEAPSDAHAPTTTTAVAAPSPPSIPVPPPPKLAASSFILMDAATHQVLAAENENERVEPASLTKVMTTYAVFDALRAGSLKLTDNVTISERAWRIGGAGTDGSTSFLPVRSQVSVEVLLRGIIVQSGNDASIALAERVAGTEEAFAQLLNSYAERLGMTGSHFENSSGLPSPNHYTTARDVALLSAALVRDFPEHYSYFAEREYTFNGIKQRNRNTMLLRDPSVDGIKTGHTKGAGYCLATSAKRDGMRLVTVVMGMSSERAREDATAALLNYGFNFFETASLFTAGQSLGETRVWKGQANQLAVGVSRDITVVIPRGRAAQLQSQATVPVSIIAPVAEGAPIGTVNVTLEGKTLLTEPLYAQAAVEHAGFFGRMFDSVRMKFE